MKKKKLWVVLGTIVAVLVAGASIGARILNKREEVDPEYTDKETNRKLSKKATFYERYIKRGIDIMISFVGVVVSAPVVAVCGLLIYFEDPGNVIFKQKRVGVNKSHFNIHKLRSMKQNTGDIPTHMLSKEEQDKMILKVGRFIRKTSIDELPQFVDILRGRMSLVGPRPALWNQDDLIAERDKYGANDVVPGLTGWAQINGRDELPIPIKARLDGEYCKALRKSSLAGFKMDCKCFFGTIKAVLSSEGVVEGGTGSMASDGYRNYADGVCEEDLIGDIGFGETAEVDLSVSKKVLITGAGSYIGQYFKNYAERFYTDNFQIDELDMIDDKWRMKDFSSYDIVYHVAGIAHADVGNVDEDTKRKYYEVNTDLAVEVAKKAKAEGVKEFVFMSSMIVYGDSLPFGQKKVIDVDTVPTPANFYGDSKLQADVAVRNMASDDFKVIVLRPPMIYGKDSKGNYPTLAKIAKKIPIFPNVDNERSMLYVGNLSEFLCQIMLVKEINRNSIVLIPQNNEWTNTADMVKYIADTCHKKLIVSSLLKPAVCIGGKIPGKIGELVNKAFGNSCYAKEMSIYQGIDYHKYSLRESIELTEGN